MSILIKGMEMPGCCGSCSCFHAENPIYCQAVKADRSKRIAAPYGLPRPDWCPLVEVPPHGRLIDADAIPYKKIMYDEDTDDFYYGVTMPYIDRMPTIIEAEEGD